MNDKTTAYWGITLSCYCPNCDKGVNLLDYVDFWDGRSFTVGECGTESSRDVEVICPECMDEFVVDLDY